jgi:hypothetical protein
MKYDESEMLKTIIIIAGYIHLNNFTISSYGIVIVVDREKLNNCIFVKIIRFVHVKMTLGFNNRFWPMLGGSHFLWKL